MLGTTNRAMCSATRKGQSRWGLEAGEYATVVRTDGKQNMLTVERKSGEALRYDPRRLQGVTVYRESERIFAEGDRIQFTAPYNEQKLANRELGTVERIDADGGLKLKMDSGRKVEFNAQQHPASRLWLRGDQPQQSGPDGGSSADPR